MASRQKRVVGTRNKIVGASARTQDRVPPPPNFTARNAAISFKAPKWVMISDCLGGELVIKEKGVLYLPMPRVDDDPVENQCRYESYLKRAVFYNVAKRTLDGMVGDVFSRDPIVQLPEEMALLEDNVDGGGVSITQQAKQSLHEVMAYGRAALLADYPATDGPVTQDQINRGEIYPSILLYKGSEVINWRTKMIGRERVYNLVVIVESYQTQLNVFQIVENPQWRVLQLLDDGTVQCQVWRMRPRNPDDPLYEPDSWLGIESVGYMFNEYILKDADGKPFDRIPFTFIGAVDNSDSVDEPPLYDLCVLNIAHYRNSADYEESCFMVGQPTAYFAGITQQWVEEVFKGKIYLGSRASVPLPVGGTAGLLQVTENSMPKEAMDQKEQQMVALGAKLIVSNTGGAGTLGEAQLEEASSASILGTAAKNVSKAYMDILKIASKFVNTMMDLTTIQFDLNTDFPAARLSPNDRNELIQEWQSGAITFSEMRDGLRRGGIATMNTEAAKQEIKANPPPDVVKAAKDNTQARPNNAPNNGNSALS